MHVRCTPPEKPQRLGSTGCGNPVGIASNRLGWHWTAEQWPV